jgi:hypothetical protein
MEQRKINECRLCNAEDYRTSVNMLKDWADTLQSEAVIDKDPKRKALRTRAVQSLLRLAQSKVMRDLALYGD